MKKIDEAAKEYTESHYLYDIIHLRNDSDSKILYTKILADFAQFLNNSVIIDKEDCDRKSKFNVGDLVIFKNTNKVKIIYSIEDDKYIITTLDGQSPLCVKESDLIEWTSLKS